MSQRRGACPALFTPMQTGDGLLARILPAEGITPAAFAAFCAAARRHGNGTIEVSARGSLQVRGLTVASAPRFADEVAALGVAALGVPVLSDPLPDDAAALIDAGALAANLRTAIADANLILAPKLCVIIDGRGATSPRCARRGRSVARLRPGSKDTAWNRPRRGREHGGPAGINRS